MQPTEEARRATVQGFTKRFHIIFPAARRFYDGDIDVTASQDFHIFPSLRKACLNLFKDTALRISLRLGRGWLRCRIQIAGYKITPLCVGWLPTPQAFLVRDSEIEVFALEKSMDQLYSKKVDKGSWFFSPRKFVCTIEYQPNNFIIEDLGHSWVWVLFFNKGLIRHLFVWVNLAFWGVRSKHVFF